jgi:hypothetical protein
MKDKFSLERIYLSVLRVENVLKILGPVFTDGHGYRPGFLDELIILKAVLLDIYEKEK